ncbi:hypothetical protein [Micromonospora sp. NPDC023644]|uniref:hypothetical protein n=1 Tax=Micromonospora sp. NPDC023644 TaxID=3154321 RepID=UPI0033F979D1
MVDLILTALVQSELSLAVDPWAPYVCARHNEQAGDAALAGFFLCVSCRDRYSTRAFSGKAPEWVSGEVVDGYCGHCNERYDDIRLAQWFLCNICERVLRSIGRGIASAKYVHQVWEQAIPAAALGLTLVETDPPQLRPRGRRTDADRISLPDFTLYSGSAPVAGFELKSGKKAATRTGGIGEPMARFQLDTTDCDDILAVIAREAVPVYLIHVQVLGRAHPPTERYYGVGLWWTDLWTMEQHFKNVDIRSRETRNAAYFDTSMFRLPDAFAAHLGSGGLERDRARLVERTPQLYRPA